MPKYTCAVFDLDGTILDTLDDLTAAVNHAMTATGRPTHPKEAVRRMIGNGVRVLIARALGEGAADGDVETALALFREYYASHIDVYTREYAGVTEMLNRLKAAGVKVCVCSNKYNAAVQELIATHFPGLFDAVIGEGGDIPRKPDPAGALHVISLAGADAAHTCFIGDSYNDWKTARNANLDSIIVTWGFGDRDEMIALQPDVLCDTMDELENAILG
jgi:phosphoglycolate phosphatase